MSVFADGSAYGDNSGSDFVYPRPPDELKLFTKYNYVNRPKTPAVRYLEHMLTKTSLTTQKATHFNIEKLGENFHKKQLQKYTEEKQRTVENAITETREVARLELEKALNQAQRAAELKLQQSLENQKSYYDKLAVRTKINRNKLEEERIEQVKRKKDEEKELALKEQWELSERLKREAIERVLIEQHKRLRAEAALEREKQIAKALRVAREHFAIKLEKQIEETREECRKIAEENAARVKEIHEVSIQRLNERIAVLTLESKQQLKKQQRAQQDYKKMEQDYSYFVDFTSPTPCHSSYLISSRTLKHGSSDSHRSRNTQTDLIALDQKSVNLQTNVQIMARR